MLDFKDLFQTIGTYVVGPVLLGASTYAIIKASEFWKSKKKKYSIKLTAEKNARIQEILTEIRIRFMGDRAYLSMFHNGDKYINGSEILKVSRTNESVSQGVSLEAHYYQDIHISLIPEEMELVADPAVSFVKTHELQDGKFRRMLISRGVKAVARAAIRQKDDIIGFLGIDFVDDDIEKPVDIDELANYYAGIVEQILSSYS